MFGFFSGNGVAGGNSTVNWNGVLGFEYWIPGTARAARWRGNDIRWCRACEPLSFFEFSQFQTVVKGYSGARILDSRLRGNDRLLFPQQELGSYYVVEWCD